MKPHHFNPNRQLQEAIKMPLNSQQMHQQPNQQMNPFMDYLLPTMNQVTQVNNGQIPFQIMYNNQQFQQLHQNYQTAQMMLFQ